MCYDLSLSAAPDKDAEAAAFHKTTPHYKGWADFKAANMETVGKSQTVVKFTSVDP